MAGCDAFPPSADGRAAGSRAGTGLRPRSGKFGLAWKGPGARASGRGRLRRLPAGGGWLRPGWDGAMRAASGGDGTGSGLGGGRRRWRVDGAPKWAGGGGG